MLSGLSPGTARHYRLAASSVIDASSVGAGPHLPHHRRAGDHGSRRGTADRDFGRPDSEDQPQRPGHPLPHRIGPPSEYGQAAPVPDGFLPPPTRTQPIEVKLAGLTPHAVYHYSLIAENDSGTTTIEDHTFNFYPPSCPNENVRQQTEANFLPDCRAYELVSPANAGGTQLFPAGPNTGRATTPSRFSYTGLFATIPGAGGSPATRAATSTSRPGPARAG